MKYSMLKIIICYANSMCIIGDDSMPEPKSDKSTTDITSFAVMFNAVLVRGDDNS